MAYQYNKMINVVKLLKDYHLNMMLFIEFYHIITLSVYYFKAANTEKITGFLLLA